MQRHTGRPYFEIDVYMLNTFSYYFHGKLHRIYEGQTDMHKQAAYDVAYVHALPVRIKRSDIAAWNLTVNI